VRNLRPVSAAVAIEVVLAAIAEGLTQVPIDNPIQQVHDAMWRHEYPRVEAIERSTTNTRRSLTNPRTRVRP